MTKPVDIEFDFGKFSDTEARCKGVTEAGKTFLHELVGSSYAGDVGLTLPKSRACDLAEFAVRKGLVVS